MRPALFRSPTPSARPAPSADSVRRAYEDKPEDGEAFGRIGSDLSHERPERRQALAPAGVLVYFFVYPGGASCWPVWKWVRSWRVMSSICEVCRITLGVIITSSSTR